MAQHTCNPRVARGFAGMTPPILPCAACEAEFIANGGFVPHDTSLTGDAAGAPPSSAEIGIQTPDLAPVSGPFGDSDRDEEGLHHG